MGGTERGDPPIELAKDLGMRVGVQEVGRGEGVGETPSSFPGLMASKKIS